METTEITSCSNFREIILLSKEATIVMNQF